MHGDALPPGVSGPEAAARFAVYRNNVAQGLVRALEARFPAVQRLVGPEYFRALAASHAAENRPQTPVLLAWGAGFPDFLAGFAPLAAYPYLADVARIELARGRAYHAADRAPIDPARLAGADPRRLRLGLHPSVQMLRSDHPAVAIWAAQQPGARAAPIPAAPQTALILRRPDHEVPVIALSPGDAGMIAALAAGRPLLAAAETAWAEAPGHDPNPLLLHLMQSGALTEPETT